MLARSRACETRAERGGESVFLSQNVCCVFVVCVVRGGVGGDMQVRNSGEGVLANQAVRTRRFQARQGSKEAERAERGTASVTRPRRHRASRQGHRLVKRTGRHRASKPAIDSSSTLAETALPSRRREEIRGEA